MKTTFYHENYNILKTNEFVEFNFVPSFGFVLIVFYYKIFSNKNIIFILINITNKTIKWKFDIIYFIIIKYLIIKEKRYFNYCTWK